MRFAIARYGFDSMFAEELNRDFINNLMEEPFIHEDTFEYALGNFNVEAGENYNFIRGTFGKVRINKFVEIYDKESKEFKPEISKEIAEVTLEFLIDPSSHLLFLEYSSKLRPEQFVRKFKAIYEHSSDHGDLKIEFIFNDEDVYEVIRRWERIEKITFRNLRPTNPSSLDSFEDIENLLKETNSEKTKLEFEVDSESQENGNQSLNADSTLIRQALALSAHGYGDGALKGKTHEGEKQEVKTRKYIRKVEVDFTEEGALDRIIQTIEEIQGGEDLIQNDDQ